MILARLGVDASAQGRGIGGALVGDALLHSAWISDLLIQDLRTAIRIAAEYTT